MRHDWGKGREHLQSISWQSKSLITDDSDTTAAIKQKKTMKIYFPKHYIINMTNKKIAVSVFFS